MSGSDFFIYFMIYALISISFSPIGEELMYRGLIHRCFQPRFGDYQASIIGTLYKCLGRFDEAVRFFQLSINSDPVKPITYSGLSRLYYYTNQFDESIAASKKVLDLNPQFPHAHCHLAEAYLLQGQPESALAEIAQEEDEERRNYGLILAYHILDRHNERDKLLHMCPR